MGLQGVYYKSNLKKTKGREFGLFAIKFQFVPPFGPFRDSPVHNLIVTVVCKKN
jgi:hypothetical protein